MDVSHQKQQNKDNVMEYINQSIHQWLWVHHVRGTLGHSPMQHYANELRGNSGSLIQPCHYLLLFSINSSLSPSHVLHLIRKCFTSFTSPLSHSVHFLSYLFKPLHLPTSICSSAVPPPLSFVNILLIFLLTPTYLASNPPLTSSFSIHSFGRYSNSSNCHFPPCTIL